MDWKLVSFLKRSKLRAEALKNLSEPVTPTELGKLLNVHRSAASRTILELEERGLTECLTPTEKLGRLYRITDKGRKILQTLVVQ